MEGQRNVGAGDEADQATSRRECPERHAVVFATVHGANPMNQPQPALTWTRNTTPAKRIDLKPSNVFRELRQRTLEECPSSLREFQGRPKTFRLMREKSKNFLLSLSLSNNDCGAA